MARVLLDFDGTLVRARRWSQCMVEVLDDLWPGHTVSADDVRPHLRDGFPWHRSQEPHLHLDSPDAWWSALGPVLERAFLACRLDPDLVPAATAAVRTAYCDPSRFHLYADTVDALDVLRRHGHQAVILSNHVPELAGIVDGLGLGGLIDEVVTSAVSGYEKPHPEAFRTGLAGCNPVDAWMIGDNPEADVAGAERVGIPATLVRHDDGAPDLLAAVRLIVAPP